MSGRGTARGGRGSGFRGRGRGSSSGGRGRGRGGRGGRGGGGRGGRGGGRGARGGRGGGGGPGRFTKASGAYGTSGATSYSNKRSLSEVGGGAEGAAVPSSSSARAEAKDRKRARKAWNDPRYEIVERAKVIWERLRQASDTDKAQKKARVDELLKVLSGHLLEVVVKHDASRVVESCLKMGSADQRLQIYQELKGNFVMLSKNEYGRFVVKKLLKYLPADLQRAMAAEFPGHIRALIKQKHASEMVEHIYVMVANVQLRRRMLEEFYGNHFALAKITAPDNADFGAVLSLCDDSRRSTILSDLQAWLADVFSKPGSNVAPSVLHRVLLDYLINAQEADVLDTVDLIAERCVDMLHTKEGAMVACRCLALAPARTRKKIVKSFKGFVVKICCEEYGHQVMVRLFDVVDDTVLVKKTLMPEMIDNLDDLLNDRYGRVVLLYTVSRDQSSFPPALKSQLTDSVDVVVPASTAKTVTAPKIPAEGNSGAQTKSVEVRKKEQAVRRRELCAALFEPLYNQVAKLCAPSEDQSVEGPSPELLTDHLAIPLIRELLRCQTSEHFDRDVISAVLPFNSAILHHLSRSADVVGGLVGGRFIKRLIRENVSVFDPNSSPKDATLKSIADLLFDSVKNGVVDYASKLGGWFIVATLMRHYAPNSPSADSKRFGALMKSARTLLAKAPDAPESNKGKEVLRTVVAELSSADVNRETGSGQKKVAKKNKQKSDSQQQKRKKSRKERA